MLGKLWRALRQPARADRLPQADFVRPADLPDNLGVSMRELAARGCEQAIAGDAAAMRTLMRACEHHPDQALPWLLAGRLSERVGEPNASAHVAHARALDGHCDEDGRISQHFYARGRLAINQRDPAPVARCLVLAHRDQLAGALRASHEQLFGTVAAVDVFSDWLEGIAAVQDVAGWKRGS